jgi:hypothetical protein
MSTTARESSVDSSKTENASIRKYLTTSTQITQKSATATATATATTTTATTTKLPLNSPSDNIVKPPFAKPATLKHSKSAIDGKRKSSTQSSNSLQAFFYQQKRQRTTAVTKGKTTTLESAASHLDTANEKWLRKPLALPSKSEQGVKNVSV